ncbi:MAG TPA: hypothetical protein VFQ36_17325, partial [Ktedonobacteraceae bacterium]|nr:hypothetical protein [Ktedonobacteraceae bacterium]
PGKGTLTMYITADDGWIISIGKDSNGDQPTPKQTIMAHPTKTKKSPIKNYPEIGDNNVPSEPILRSIKVNFPAAGVYPVEIDYTECCGDQMTLVITNDFTPVQS